MTLPIARRKLLVAAFGLAGAGFLPVVRSRAVEGADATVALQGVIDAAVRAGRPAMLPAGTLQVGTLHLPDGAHLIGIPGATRLSHKGDGPLIAAKGAARVALSGLAF